MAETSKQPKSKTPFTTPFMSEQMWEDLGFSTWSDRVQALGEAQARTFRHMTEQYLTYTRQINEQLSSQMQVSAKLVKDSLDYGINLMDAWNKIVLESTQSAIDHMTPKN